MIKAAIDIGTNSTRLYIGRVGKTIERIEKRTTITRLGKDVDSERKLSLQAIEKTVCVLMDYERKAQSYGASEIIAIATSAVRDAENRDEFIGMIKDKTGIDVKVISGDEEARLDFAGASQIIGGTGIVIDIGGGSTEIILGNKGKIQFADSIDIGSVRITEKFMNTDNITDDQICLAAQYIKNAIAGAVEKIKGSGYAHSADCRNVGGSCGGSFEIAGIGGTITSLAAVNQGLKVYDIDKVHGYKIYRDNVCSMFDMFARCGIDERKKIRGLQMQRADIIPAGTLILRTIMEELDSEYITVSECDNLDGMIKCY